MKPDETELNNLKVQIKEEFLKEVKRRAVEKLLQTNNDRLEKYYAKLVHQLSEDMAREFPL